MNSLKKSLVALCMVAAAALPAVSFAGRVVVGVGVSVPPLVVPEPVLVGPPVVALPAPVVVAPPFAVVAAPVVAVPAAPVFYPPPAYVATPAVVGPTVGIGIRACVNCGHARDYVGHRHNR
jgi:hypothetical protein